MTAQAGVGRSDRNCYGELTLENWVSSASAGVMPRFSHIWPVRAGHELPAKMSVLRIVANPCRALWRVEGGELGDGWGRAFFFLFRLASPEWATVRIKRIVHCTMVALCPCEPATRRCFSAWSAHSGQY